MSMKSDFREERLAKEDKRKCRKVKHNKRTSKKPKLLQVGDVFMSEQFYDATYTYKIFAKKKAGVMRSELKMDNVGSMGYSWTEHAPGGFSKKHNSKLNLRPTKRRRIINADSEWVVISTEMSGGGTGRGGMDTYSDGHYVTAKKLDSFGNWDAACPIVTFYQTGSFSNMIKPEELKVTGKMVQEFIRVID